MNLETKYIGNKIQNVIKNSITLSSSVNFSIQGFSASICPYNLSH